MTCRAALLWILVVTLPVLASSQSRAQDQSEALRHSALGAAAAGDENWPLALTEYSLAFHSDTSSNFLLARVIHCVFEMGRDDDVMSLTRVLWKRDSTQDEAAADAGEMAFLHGRMDEAVEWFSAAARSKPGQPEHWVRLGLVYEHMDRLGASDSSLSRACQADPDMPQALYHLGLVRARAGHEKEAIPPLVHLAAIAPDYPHGLIMLAQIQENTHALDDARQTYTHAAQLEVDGEDREEAQRGIARIAFSQGHPEDALGALSGLIATHPEEVGLRRLRLQAELKMRKNPEALAELDTLSRLDANNPAWPGLQSRVLGQMGKSSEARATARRFQERHPGSYRAYEILGEVDLEQRKYDDALKELDRARKLAPDSASVVYLRGQVLAAAGRNPEAEEAFVEATRLDTTYEDAFFGLGVVRERMGRLEPAESAFRRVLTLDPRNATVLNYVGYMFADRGLKLEESLKEINQALEQEPDNAAFLDSKGWTLYRLGRWGEAREGLQEALEKGGRDPLIREHLGDVLVALKQYREAAEAYREALRGDPANGALKKKLHELEPRLR